MADENEARVPTNLRLLLMLEAVAQSAQALTPSELGREVGLPKQTVHRLCNILLQERFLVRDEQGGGLRPGRRARELASGIVQASTAHFARRRVLEKLASDIGETINFVVPEDGGMAYHDRVETDWPFRIQFPVGSQVPFHCTASGKTYLASLANAERRRLVAVMALSGQTANTITEPEAMLEELAQIRKQGFALDNEEFIEGMVAASVPVRDHSGKYFASLACHGPIQRLSISDAEGLVPSLKIASSKLTELLFE